MLNDATTLSITTLRITVKKVAISIRAKCHNLAIFLSVMAPISFSRTQHNDTQCSGKMSYEVSPSILFKLSVIAPV
jgi:hypothetical protein